MLTARTNYSNDSNVKFHMFVPKSCLLEKKLDLNFEIWKVALKFFIKILRGPKEDAYFKALPKI